MTFEIIKKGLKGGVRIDPDTISVSSSTVSFGDNILKKFGKRGEIVEESTAIIRDAHKGEENE